MVAANLPQRGPHYASLLLWHVSHAEAARRFYPFCFWPEFEFQYGDAQESFVGGDIARHDFADDHAASVCLVEQVFGLGAVSLEFCECGFAVFCGCFLQEFTPQFFPLGDVVLQVIFMGAGFGDCDGEALVRKHFCVCPPFKCLYAGKHQLSVWRADDEVVGRFTLHLAGLRRMFDFV